MSRKQPRNLADRPHTIRRHIEPCVGGRAVGTRVADFRCLSPDEQYYYRLARHPTKKFGSQEVIFATQTDERVAHIYKWDWSLFPLAWDDDVSGFFFAVIPRGVFGNADHAGHPVYKLLVPGAEPGPKMKRMPLPDTAGQIGEEF